MFVLWIFCVNFGSNCLNLAGIESFRTEFLQKLFVRNLLKLWLMLFEFRCSTSTFQVKVGVSCNL